MKVQSFLATLRDRDIQVWAEGDRLRCNAPAGTLSPDLREELRQRKAEILEFLRTAGSLARQQRAIVPLQRSGTRPPIFAFGGHNGDVFCFRALAQHLGEDQPFFGLEPPGLDGVGEPLDRVEDLATYFATANRTFQPEGPYVIAGFCAGGTIAFELARQLLRDGAGISGLALFGAPYPTSYRLLPQLRKRFEARLERLARHIRALAALTSVEKRQYIAAKLRQRKARAAPGAIAAPDPVLVWREKVARATFAALRRYVPRHFDGRLSLFLPCHEWARSREEPLRWCAVARQTEEYYGPDRCDTDVMLLEPYASTFAALFRQSRAATQRTLSGDSERAMEFSRVDSSGISASISPFPSAPGLSG